MREMMSIMTSDRLRTLMELMMVHRLCWMMVHMLTVCRCSVTSFGENINDEVSDINLITSNLNLIPILPSERQDVIT